MSNTGSRIDRGTSMTRRRLLWRSLIHYRHTNLPVVLGIAVAVAVFSGALLVGQSVRESLRRMLDERIGATRFLVAAQHYFNEDLGAAADLKHPSCPLIHLKGVVIREKTGVRMHEVNVYGIDDRFWRFHSKDVPDIPEDRDSYVGQTLAQQLGMEEGDTLLLRVELPQSIPREWLYGRRDQGGRTLRLNCQRILPVQQLGEFSLRPSPGGVYSIFVPLRRLQKDLGLPHRVNTLLLNPTESNVTTAAIFQSIKKRCTLQDFGLRLRAGRKADVFSLESDRILLDDTTVLVAEKAAASLGLDYSPVYTYLANAIRADGKEIPYSVITAADIGKGALRSIKANTVQTPGEEALWLTEWAQRRLDAYPGQTIEIDYYLWQEEGRLETRTSRFRLAGILPNTEDLDPSFAPHIPGVTDAKTINTWDPPFPLDMTRIRPEDEEYWNRYKTTPKAFVGLHTGQRLWQSRFGKTTALRINMPQQGDPAIAQDRFSRILMDNLNLESSGFSILSIREQGLGASRGSTDFGEYFLYFSFFLIAAAFMTAVLFFRLMVEQRVKEIGILQACGFSAAALRRQFLFEGWILSTLGAIAGLLGSLVYGRLMVFGLRAWWSNALDTERVSFHVSWTEPILGCLCGMLLSTISLAWTLRSCSRGPVRQLLAGVIEPPTMRRRRSFILGFACLFAIFLALVLPALSAWGKISPLQGFFGGGFLLMVGMLCGAGMYFRGNRPAIVDGQGFTAWLKLALRSTTYRPARSLFCTGLIAAAVFVVVSTEAFRKDTRNISMDRLSGTGGYSLLAQSTLPILHDPNRVEGLEAMGLSPEQISELRRTHFVPFRRRPGDDASCLNLYAAQDPEVLGAPRDFLSAGRFSFQASLATENAHKKNPWLLLEEYDTGSSIPAIADADTLQYILRIPLGGEMVLRGDRGVPARLRFVAALKGSVFQGKLIISESHFLRAFPEHEGYAFFLLEAPPESQEALITTLQEAFADYGLAVESSKQKLAAFHRVENTYLSTFQSLGTLGLILGTIGLGTVLFRNVMERRRELAMLRAVGFSDFLISAVVLCENIYLISLGLVTGVLSSFLAILPSLQARGDVFPLVKTGVILLSVLAAGLLSSFIALIAARREPMLVALRSE